MSGPQTRKRDFFRHLVRPPRATSSNPSAHSNQTVTVSASHSPTPQPRPIPPPAAARRILDAAVEALSPAQQATLRQHGAYGTYDIRAAVEETYNAAEEKKRQCDDKRWRCTFRGKDVVLGDAAHKVILWVDRFKSVGDVAANAAPVYAGLPWAGIRMILEATVSEQRQMTALLTGMDLTLAMANRLKVYMEYFERLPSSSATTNFERALIEMYAHLLRFIANAIETYQKNSLTRLLASFWQASELERFESDGDKLGTRAEREANNCDRELQERNWKEARQWKADLEASLKRLDDIRTLQSSVDLLHVKVDLSRLTTAKGAEYNSLAEDGSPECLQGTRTELLRQVADWSDDAQSKGIFWLCGKAGTGKSTISRTVSRRLDQQKRLGASFFFKRGERDRGGASHFFGTVALQLVHHVPGLDQSIATALGAEYDLQGKALQKQFERLLLEPLSQVTLASQLARELVIVVDALDECDRDGDKRSIVRLLAQLQNIGTLRLRVFITSRPELPVRLGFAAVNSDLYYNIKLEEVQASTIEHDIRRYLEHQFREMQRENWSLQSYDPLPSSWPHAEDVDTLVDLAVPLFIFAFTVCRYISEANPRERLASVLYQAKAGRTSFSELDKTYLPILNQILGTDEGDQERETEDFRALVGPIILLAIPLRPHCLSALLEIPLATIDKVLRPLHSVLDVPANPARPVRLLHLSFRDFLVDPRGQHRHKFYVDERRMHARLARQCVRLVGETSPLKRDLLDLQAPGRRRNHVSPDTLRTALSDEASYACSYWAMHVLESQEALVDDEYVHKFLEAHLLHWLEALSWLGSLSLAVTYISDLRSQVQNESGDRLGLFLSDALRFTLRNRYAIDLAPLQVYASGLVLAPRESILKKVFHHEIMEDVMPLFKLPSRWSAELLKLEGHERGVNAVAFSPDGQTVASASNDQTVRLWNAQTGEQTQTLNGHDDWVNAVAFSPDGQTVASASRHRTVRLWNAQTGEQTQTLNGHDD